MPTASTSCGLDGSLSDSESEPVATTAPTQPDVLNELLLRMTRAVLQHPEAESLYAESGDSSNKPQLYRILGEYFTRLQTRHKRAVVMQLGRPQLRVVVEFCAGQSLTALYMASGVADLSTATTAPAFIARSPLLSLESVRTRLTQHGSFFLAPALAQVLELSRRLDGAFGVQTPLGAINATHLVALTCALYASSTLAELVTLTATLFLIDWPRRVASGPLPDASVVWLAVHMLDAVWAEWGVLDKAHESGWHRLAQCLGATALLHEACEYLPPDHLERLHSRVLLTLQEDALLHLFLSRGPDLAMSLDPPLPSARPTGSAERTSAPRAAPEVPELHDDSDDHTSDTAASSEDEEEGQDEAIDRRFWLNLAG